MIKAYVEFRVPQLFVDEVKVCAGELDDGIARVTQLHKRDGAHTHNVFVMATAIHQDKILRLTAPIGSLGFGDKKDEQTRKQADKVEKDLNEQLNELGVDVRGGYITAATGAT